MPDYLRPVDLLSQGRIYISPRCERCGRRGRYALINLPPDLNIADFLIDVAADCPKRRASSVYDRCDVIDAGDGQLW